MCFLSEILIWKHAFQIESYLCEFGTFGFFQKYFQKYQKSLKNMT